MSPRAGTPSEARVTAVHNAAKAWAGQLIDLGGRNTLLFYRDLKAGTLDLTGSPDTALHSLLERRTVRLSSLFSPERLGEAVRRARTVSAKARENFEERGLSTLYLAHGMASWAADATTAATPAAPVLLAQISLRAVGAGEADYDLALIDDWEPNPTLLHLLQSSFDVTVNSDDLLEAAEARRDPGAACSLLAARAASVPGFAVTARTVVGNFSYVKQPMVIDLETSLDLMVSNPLISALAGDPESVAALRSDSIGVGLDEPDRIRPADEFIPIDADASQNFVINAAIQGKHLVVQGPPGTGKSQTIANLIAALSARGRSVLFVAEKRAAIDAVVSRLHRVGLEALVLDLHGAGSSRKRMAEELKRIYESSATVPAVNRSSEDGNLEESRSRLNRHVAALHEPRVPWGVSVFELQARLIRMPTEFRLPSLLSASQLPTLNEPEMHRVADAISDWVTMGGPAVERRVTPWARAADNVTTVTQAEAALTSASVLSSITLPAAVRSLEQTIAECGLRRPTSVGAWSETLALLRNVAEIQSTADPSVWALDLTTLVSAIAPAAKNGLARVAASLFNSEYRTAKKTLAAALRRPLDTRALYAFALNARSTRDEWLRQRIDAGAPRLPGNLDGTSGAYTTLVTELAALGAFIGTEGLLDTDTGEAGRSLAALIDDKNTLFKLPRLHELARLIDKAGFEFVRRVVIERGLNADDARTVVECVWSSAVLEWVSLHDREIGAFDGGTHSRNVARFVAADRSQIEAGAAKVRRAVAESLRRVRNNNPVGDATVAAEVRKRARHRSLRELTQIAPDILLGLKPCWAMSPLAVSQLLDARQLFDVVIFDEASQVPPADAIPALMRARQVIVAGDSKQLPPTAFFASATGEDDGDTANQLGNLTSGSESVLDAMANVITAGSVSLRWHYRSRDERLIAFSNAQSSLYDWQMVTFPGAASQDAIEHIHVPWRPSAGSSEDSAGDEVKRVVELIADHAHTTPHETLGVIAMGINHANRITEALRQARIQDSRLNAFCEAHPDEQLFVKNLERVQGDERDAIILSVGYGKGADGRMLYRFGPINNEGGERRLNVAVTRARSRMKVVSSFTAHELDPLKLRSEGAKMLGRYLAYAASGGTDLGTSARSHPPLNSFESDVRRRLAQAGIPLVPQLGVSGYFIDFAAQHPNRPGEYVLAIEADGASYHASATARERDRLRQEHLERLGWRFHRIWSTDWFRHPETEVAKALAAWQAAVAISDRTYKTTRSASQSSPASWAPPSTSSARHDAPSTTPPTRSARRPTIFPNGSIGDYDATHLLEIVRWVDSDGLLRSNAELVEEVIKEMGFRRRGKNIVDAISKAVSKHALLREPRRP